MLFLKYYKYFSLKIKKSTVVQILIYLTIIIIDIVFILIITMTRIVIYKYCDVITIYLDMHKNSYFRMRYITMLINYHHNGFFMI